MRLNTKLDIYLSGETIKRKPNFWDNLKSHFTEVDLSTKEAKITVGSMGIISQFEDAFKTQNIKNAMMLSVDEQILFHDKKSEDNDLDFLVTSLVEHIRIFSEDFKKMDLVMEHYHAGLHMILDTRISKKYRKNESPVQVYISAQIQELRPAPDESQEDFQERVKNLVSDKGFFERYQAVFNAFIDDLVKNIQVNLRALNINIQEPTIRVIKPNKEKVKELVGKNPKNEKARIRSKEELKNTNEYYDPYDRYYYDPLGTVASVLIIGTLINSAFLFSPPVGVYGMDGGHISDASDIQDNLDSFSDIEGLADEDLSNLSESAAEDFEEVNLDDIDTDDSDFDSDSDSFGSNNDGDDSGFFGGGDDGGFFGGGDDGGFFGGGDDGGFFD